MDFHIAFYIGRLAAEVPDTFFHVISKDKGFDPLIKHLKTQKIFAARSVTIADIPILKAPLPESVKPDKLGSVIEKLKSQKAAKPRTLKTLGSTIKSYLANQLEGDELEQIIGTLTTRGIVRISEGKVAYSFPD